MKFQIIYIFPTVFIQGNIMTEFIALDDEICYLPDNIDSDLFKSFKEVFPDDLPIIALKKDDLQIFFEKMYDIKNIKTYNICANVASYLMVNDYYPYHYFKNIANSAWERLNETTYNIPNYIFTLNLSQIIKAGDLQFIIIKNLTDNPDKLWREATEYGKLNIIKWLHLKEFEGCTVWTMNKAAEYGHFDIVKWLHENRNEGCTVVAMNVAAMKGHFDILKWLHENRTEGCTGAAMDWVAKHGDLELVIWLHENRTEGCTTDAMDDAAGCGYLDIVKWLHGNRTEGCTKEALTAAALYGDEDIAQWLYDNRDEVCISYSMDDLLGDAQYDAVECLDLIEKK